MGWLSSFFQQNFILIYFFYGLAFFAMGLAIMLESRRASDFPLAKALRPLAGFGLIHGLHEWFEMFELLDAAGATNVPGWLLLPQVRILHLAISFMLLVVFGIELIYANRSDESGGRRRAVVAAGALGGIWLTSWYLTVQLADVGPAEAEIVADVLSRYMLAIPGALLAAWAMYLERRAFVREGMPQFARAMQLSALALLLYGVVGQLFVRPAFFFPANVLNSALFVQTFGVPVQLLRALLAVLMAGAVIRALHVFELESRRRLASAHNRRLAAEREAKRVEAEARQMTDVLNADLQEAVEDMSVLQQLSRWLAATLEQDVIVHEIFPRFVAAEARLAGGLLSLNGEAGQPAVMVQAAGPALPAPVPALQRMARRVAATVLETGAPAGWNGNSVIPLPEPGDGRCGELQLFPDNVIIFCVPLRIEQEVAGAIALWMPGAERPATSRDCALLHTAARQFSVALYNAALYREVHDREALRGELLQQVVTAQEAERQRIARELHDGPGQTLTGLGLGLAAAMENLRRDPAAAEGMLVDLKGLSSQSLQELRDIIADLRPSVLDDLGLVAAMRSQLQALQRRSGVETALHIEGRRSRLDPRIETVVFRVVQEALNNVAKHAGATRVDVRLHYTPEQLAISVRDNGSGFDADGVFDVAARTRQGWGLLGMKERAGLVNGRFNLHSVPGQGTTVNVMVPLATPLEVEEYGQNQIAAG